MNNASLARSLRTIVADCGYDCVCGDKKRMAAMLPAFPAAWLDTPQLHSVEGRNSGRITYDVVLHLMDAAADLSPEKRQQRLDQMEKDMLQIFTLLSEDKYVTAVTDLTVTPASFSLTNRGEVSQTARARVITWF